MSGRLVTYIIVFLLLLKSFHRKVRSLCSIGYLHFYKYNLKGSPLLPLLCSLSIRFVGKASHAAGFPCCCACQCWCVSVVVHMLLCSLSIRFVGKASHAAGFPWQGVNALDAAVVCYTSISCLRQQLKPTWRVHGQPSRHAPLNTSGGPASPHLRFTKVSATISIAITITTVNSTGRWMLLSLKYQQQLNLVLIGLCTRW